MCDCVDVDFGTYANAISLYPPPELGLTRIPVTVDRCIAEEVLSLWITGVVTTGNCCGHNKLPGFISVKESSIVLMERLGYEHYEHPLDQSRRDHFHPRSLQRE